MVSSDAAPQDSHTRPNSTRRRYAGTDCRCLECELVPLPRRHRCSHPVIATTPTVGLVGGLGVPSASGEWNADSRGALYETRMGWVRWIRRNCCAGRYIVRPSGENTAPIARAPAGNVLDMAMFHLKHRGDRPCLSRGASRAAAIGVGGAHVGRATYGQSGPPPGMGECDLNRTTTLATRNSVGRR